MTSITTADNQTVSIGDVVCAFYSGRWGVIASIDSQGWADVACSACGTKVGLADGQRLATRLPRTNPFFDNPTVPVCQDCDHAIEDHLDRIHA